MERARRGKPNHREQGRRSGDERRTGAGPVNTAGTAYAEARTLRRWWLTRRLHIDLLRVCSAFGR
ncbi:hypothetical protein [Streptomyces sp. NPDC059072]|uniref:hypothetical protein n=1 Tax=Streptomyces sp. NPDC059072 TaxID=3346715 RepID=UPI0036B7953D